MKRCAFPLDRGGPCGARADSIVDVYRDEDDQGATFFTLPMCFGHRLALGPYVVHAEPIDQ